ncbi:variable large family protein (plasmid) [Borrelia coriaceae]|uniref:Variable large protein n=1 Tax=Borrelia coriaceae ATCC 43381 TaxID=1408429 RepID=W5SXD6_9SPIR|nr:variable large family protein [Borrelia coriaceae]AHH11542.1 Variable outer membrane protein [Borrelia coriaceae ATCC 43381]UPA17158.1 variable large family protein [Borrelia coriaceae]
MKINIKNIKVKSICAILFISLFLSCNNGVIEELEKRNQFLSSMASLGNDFLSIFTSFGDMIGGVLGFNAETKKSAVAAYFKTVQDTLESTKDRLNNVVTTMKNENHPNVVGTEATITTLNEKLIKIIAGAKKVYSAIGEGANDEVGKVVKGNDISGKPTGVGNIIEGLKEIVEIVLKAEGNHQAGTTTKAEDGSTARAQDTGAAHLFIKKDIASDAKKAAADASKAVGAVSGADILKAIHSETKVKTLAENEDGTNAVAAAAAKDALIAGALVVRGMAKDGKFATASNGNDAKDEIKNAVASAIKMALNTLNLAIMKTIDFDLKSIKDLIKVDLVTPDNGV